MGCFPINVFLLNSAAMEKFHTCWKSIKKSQYLQTFLRSWSQEWKVPSGSCLHWQAWFSITAGPSSATPSWLVKMWRSWFTRCCTSILTLAIFCQKHKVWSILTELLFTMWLAVAAHIWLDPPPTWSLLLNSSVHLGFSVTALTDSFIAEVDGSWAGTETSVSFPTWYWTEARYISRLRRSPRRLSSCSRSNGPDMLEVDLRWHLEEPC